MKKDVRCVQREMLGRLMMTVRGHDVFAVHRDLMSTDPSFYQQLALWYARHGHQLAHREAFAAQLLCEGTGQGRTIGLEIFRRLDAGPAHRVVARVRRSAPELARSLRRSAAPRRGLLMWLRARRRVGRSVFTTGRPEEVDKPCQQGPLRQKQSCESPQRCWHAAGAWLWSVSASASR